LKIGLNLNFKIRVFFKNHDKSIENLGLPDEVAGTEVATPAARSGRRAVHRRAATARTATVGEEAVGEEAFDERLHGSTLLCVARSLHQLKY
jgi:hypothetical protein